MSRPVGSKNKPKIAIIPSVPRDDTLNDGVPFVLDLIPPEPVFDCSIPTVEGWANLCASHFTVLGKKMDGYYLGGDIHKTLEDAKKLAGTTVVGQVYIRWCDTRKVKVQDIKTVQTEAKDGASTPSTPEE